MLNVIFILSSLLATPICDFQEVDFPTFEVSYKGASTTLEVNAPDAKIIACDVWKDFPELLVTEIDLGAAGTFSMTRQTDLVIFDIKSKVLKQIFRKMIQEETESKSEPIKITYAFKLEKTKDGNPSIRWVRSKKVDVIDLSQ